MKTTRRISQLLLSLAMLLPSCGQQLVESTNQDMSGGAAGLAGMRAIGGARASAVPSGGNAGINGTAGTAGNSRNRGTAGSIDSTSTGALAGIQGFAGTAGSRSNGGFAGYGGIGGASGTSASGTAGIAGRQSNGDVAGSSGLGSTGMAGHSGTVSIVLSVASTNPADADLNVPINKVISANFSEAMNPLTVTSATFTVTGPGATPVAGTVKVIGSAVTFKPSNELAPNTTYLATLMAGVTAVAGDGLANAYVWTFKTGTGAAQAMAQLSVPLGSSSNFAILAAAAITNIPTSMIIGDVGLTPEQGSNISGFSAPLTCPEVSGNIYAVDASGPACAVVAPVRLAAAKIDAGIAFSDAKAASRGTPQAISGNLNGLTLYPGLYESGSSLQISPGGILYLDAEGDGNAIFIIRSASTITTEAMSEVVLTKGAKATNVYWTADSAVTLGANSSMKGTIIAGSAISLLSGAILEGRALNQGAAAAAITLDACTIAVPVP